MRKTTVSILLFITTMIFSMSVFASDISSNGFNVEPEYAMIAGLPDETIAGDIVNHDNAYKISMNSSIEFVHLKLEKRKPDDEIKFNQSVAKVLNDAKMQNSNFDRVAVKYSF